MTSSAGLSQGPCLATHICRTASAALLKCLPVATTIALFHWQPPHLPVGALLQMNLHQDASRTLSPPAHTHLQPPTASPLVSTHTQKWAAISPAHTRRGLPLQPCWYTHMRTHHHPTRVYTPAASSPSHWCTHTQGPQPTVTQVAPQPTHWCTFACSTPRHPLQHTLPWTPAAALQHFLLQSPWKYCCHWTGNNLAPPVKQVLTSKGQKTKLQVWS